MSVEEVNLESFDTQKCDSGWKIDFSESESGYALFIRIANPPATPDKEWFEPLTAIRPYNVDVWGSELLSLRVIRKTEAEIAKVVKALSDRGVNIPERLRYLGGLS